MAAQTTALAQKAAELQAASTLALANTSKRDKLRDIERQMQERWEEAKLFEANAPTSEDPSLQTLSEAELKEKYPKWFGNFPYPYMNGSLHLGHAFSISKIEFGSGFERTQGKRVLFPLGFHATGMPIKAASDKLIREMEKFGQDFENYSEEEASSSTPVASAPASKEDQTTPSTSATKSNVDKAKKGKIVAKSTGLTHQFQVMESIGVPRAEIKKFADPGYWLEYFPPIAKRDLSSFGARIDWRRSFLTTHINPYYDSFVRWQMNKLYELGYIQFGERYTIFSPKDGQPCMDHDRQSGEAVGPQEYIGIKMEVVDWAPAAANELAGKADGKKVYFVGATLRPETMYGQTNCFVGTTITYGLFSAKDENAVYLCTDRAARNMAYQGLLRQRDKVERIAQVSGKSLVGTLLHVPFSVAPKSQVYVLPMENVLANKGTGVVMSCPSDSPDDYATTQDLYKKAEYYNVQREWIIKDPIPVIKTPNYGDLIAPTLCKQMKINSQKDVKQLAEAKEIAYKEGFYQGVLLVGEFAGQRVEDAKNKVRDLAVKSGAAVIYSEPESPVVSRSADECVVALCDQWYMAYGDASWKEKGNKLLAKMNVYNSETRNSFQATMAWLHEWACARSYGLGSRLPWDKQFLVESLSDSTIYMAYYTVCHLLHSDVEGHVVGPLGVKAEDMTDDVWDFLFRNKTLPEDGAVTKEQGAALLNEFKYWYPMDIRSSGKDLLNNHLAFCIYVHSALFEEDRWPLSMRANGHLLLNGKKMSKSTGNSLTLADSIEKFGADATRIALADAGDGVEDANFEEYTANASILRLHALIDWSEDTVKSQDQYRSGPHNFYDSIFINEMSDLVEKTRKAYSQAMYKEALKYGLYEMLNARDWYRDATGKEKGLQNGGGMHRDLLLQYIKLQALLLVPITPHTSDYIWTQILGEKESVQNIRFPSPTQAVDHGVLESAVFARSLVKTIRDAELVLQKKKAKGKAIASNYDMNAPKALDIYVVRDYPAWQTACVDAVREVYDPATKQTDKTKLKEALTKSGMLKDKRVMPFCVLFQTTIDTLGAERAFNREIPFDEAHVLSETKSFLQRQLNFESITVHTSDSSKTETEEAAKLFETAEPRLPSFVFRNVSST